MTQHPGIQLPASAPPPGPRQHTAKTVCHREPQKFDQKKSKKLTEIQAFSKSCEHRSASCPKRVAIASVRVMASSVHHSRAKTVQRSISSSHACCRRESHPWRPSVSSLAYPSHVPVNFLPNRVQSSASNQLASSISSFAYPELPMLLLHRSVFFPTRHQTIKGMASSVLPLAYSNRDQRASEAWRSSVNSLASPNMVPKTSRSFCRREHAHWQCQDSDFAADQYGNIRIQSLAVNAAKSSTTRCSSHLPPSTPLFFT